MSTIDGNWPSVALAVLLHTALHHFEPTSATPAIVVVGFAPLVLLVRNTLNWTFFSFFQAYALYLASLSLSVILYRVSPLHPLYHIPGPVANKITKAVGMYYSYSGKHHLILKSLHEKYGPVVRTGPNEVSIVDADAVIPILGAGGLQKGQYYDGRRDPNAPGNLVVLRGDAHANRRRLWNRGMSTESLKEYETFITNRAHEFVAQLQSKTEPIDLAKWIGFFTFDVMGDMAFGKPFGMLKDGADKEGLWDVLERFAIMCSVVSHVPWASHLLQKIPFIARDLQQLRKFGVDLATHRLQHGAIKKDLWYHLSDEAGFEKDKPPVKNVVADGATAIVAGADTTSSALSSLFFFLLSEPNKYNKLVAEVDAVFPADEDPLDVSKHSELPYLTACINEALRLHPPAMTSGPRRVPEDSQGKHIIGHFIPAGTQIYVPPYVLHHDARYYDSPEEFIPERWLDDANPPNPTAFIPFSYGPANCVGKNLAKQEMMMIMSLLLTKFEFSFASGFKAEAWPEQLHDHFVSIRGPLMVTVRLRGA